MRVLIILCLLLAASPALAQIGPSVGGAGNYGGSGLSGSRSGLPAKSHDDDEDAAKKPDDKPAEPPPSIPGAMPDSEAVVIPSDKVAAEMSPNDALFDAINRGDLAAAKDALNRGAQLDSHNVLGQTPTDAAIDLSRNDITFLLLSMRGSVASTRVAAGSTADKPTPPGKHGRAMLVKTKPKPVRSAPVIADRGTPNPAVGFTGF
jgi:hypothetical protein